MLLLSIVLFSKMCSSEKVTFSQIPKIHKVKQIDQRLNCAPRSEKNRTLTLPIMLVNAPNLRVFNGF